MTTPTLMTRTAYVMAVSDALADLPADDRVELIEELDDHVSALLADRPDADLVAELGTPASYAADLRAAAGLGGPTPSTTRRLRDWATDLSAALPPWTRPVFAAARPVWWVVRGVAIALAVAYWFQRGLHRGGGNPDIGLLCWLAVVAVASVWLGQRRVDGARRIVVIAVNVVAVFLALWVTATWSSALFSGGDYYGTAVDNGTPCSDTANLYAYDAGGRPLTGVRLYDQNGNPFDVSATDCGDTGFDHSVHPGVYPYPTSSSYDDGVPSGPPTSLAPLPGATVSPSATTPSPPSVSPRPTATTTRR